MKISNQFNRIRIAAFLAFIVLFFGMAHGQIVNVDVNLNINHTIDTIKTFQRSKFVAIHADVTEPEWDTGWGPNFTPDVRKDFLDGYDVYLGRNTGPITGELNNAKQDPNRPGFADSTYLAARGASSIAKYASKTSWHRYEHRNNLVICAQLHPFYPDGALTKSGWAVSQTDTAENPFGTASGEFMGKYLKDYFGSGGTTGQPKPNLVEVINEPLYFISDITSVFKYHNSVAKEIKKLNPDVEVGGYTIAFPDLDKNNFQEWNDREKYFMDYCGENMDFWSIHMYDFPAFGGKQLYRKGSNMEATLDMMEQYSILKFGKAKPFVVSEFGASSHDYQGKWTPYRDWLHIKSVNSMMMQFMERPNTIAQTINFLILKATWGTTDVNHTYENRLMRLSNEPQSYTGTWIYTDMVKIYQLWADVKGKRVDIRSTNPDVLTDAYVDGNKAYVILNNLAFEDEKIKINLSKDDSLAINNLMVKNLYLSETNAVKDQNVPILDTIQYTSGFPVDFTLKPEATMILEYTYPGDIKIDEKSQERKYYADSYFKPITSNNDIDFNVNGIQKGSYGESVLRLGIGRNHGLLLKPIVKVNGTEVVVPDNFRGGPQTDRPDFFGVIEVPVPYDEIQANNKIQVKFPDNGGYVSSVSLRTYEFSKKINRSDSVSGISVYPTSTSIGIGQNKILKATIIPSNAVDKRIMWMSSNESVASVDSTGKVTGVATGEAIITAKTSEGGYTAECSLSVQTDYVPVLVDSINVTTDSAEVFVGKQVQLNAIILPVDADDKTITWTSSSESVATVDSQGLVTAISEGSATIKATATDGKFGACAITTKEIIPGLCHFDETKKYTSTVYQVDGKIDVNVTFNATTGTIVNGDGIKFWLRIIKDRTSWAVVKDYVVYDTSAAGQSSGSASASISLKDVVPSDELPNSQFYFLWVTFTQNDGVAITQTPGLFPIQIARTTGVNDFRNSDISLYPNPASKMVTIRGTGNYTYARIKSLSGSVVEQVSIANRMIDISDLTCGMYLVELSGNDRTSVKKLIISR